MGYLDAFTIIESTFKDAFVVTSGNQINQSGTYLFFDGSVANNKVEDTLSFTVAIAAHSLTKENGVMGEVDKLEHAIDHGVAKGYQGINAPHGQAVAKLEDEFFHERC